MHEWTSAKVGTDKKESTLDSLDVFETAAKSKDSESKASIETMNTNKQIIIERTVTKHETMEVISSSVHQMTELRDPQKVTKTSSEKHQTVTKTSSEQQHLSKTTTEIPSDAEIDKQISDFVQSTTEEEAKTLLEQISNSHSMLYFSIFSVCFVLL